MTKNALLTLQDNDIAASLRTWLTGLLSSHTLDALLVLLEEKDRMPAMALVSHPDRLQYVSPLAPIMPGNAAKIVSRLTRLGSPHRSIGVVLRPCEIRALIELVKLKQASLENITIIGMDCSGTYPLSSYRNGPKGSGELRTACRICEYPSPINADITIGATGEGDHAAILLQANNMEGEKLLPDNVPNEPSAEDLASREKMLLDMRKKRTSAKENLFEEANKEICGSDNLLKTLEACTGCHNCRVMCPICYCKECFFDSPTFDFEADKFLGWAEKKGAMKMPSDTLLYHLTRLNHMAASCVACGMCSEACPNGVPVFEIFSLVSSRVQEELDYVPGRDVNEELPLSIFREDEFQEIGK